MLGVLGLMTFVSVVALIVILPDTLLAGFFAGAFLAGAFFTAAFFLAGAFLAAAFFAGFLFVVMSLTLVHPWHYAAEL